MCLLAFTVSAMGEGLSKGQKSPFILPLMLIVIIIAEKLSDVAACTASLPLPGLRREDRTHLLFWQVQLMPG